MKLFKKSYSGVWHINLPTKTLTDGRKMFWGRIQLHTPRWTFENGDYYFMFPTVFRIIWGGNSRMTQDQPEEIRAKYKEYGAGVVILGFGAAICWEIYKNSND